MLHIDQATNQYRLMTVNIGSTLIKSGCNSYILHSQELTNIFVAYISMPFDNQATNPHRLMTAFGVGI